MGFEFFFQGHKIYEFKSNFNQYYQIVSFSSNNKWWSNNHPNWIRLLSKVRFSSGAHSQQYDRAGPGLGPLGPASPARIFWHSLVPATHSTTRQSTLLQLKLSQALSFSCIITSSSLKPMGSFKSSESNPKPPNLSTPFHISTIPRTPKPPIPSLLSL